MRLHLCIRLRGVFRSRVLAELLGAAAPQTPYVSCPECGTGQVKRLAQADDIDRISRVPWSVLQRYFGGRLFYCPSCRLQFHDCRRKVLAPAHVDRPALHIVRRSRPVLIAGD